MNANTTPERLPTNDLSLLVCERDPRPVSEVSPEVDDDGQPSYHAHTGDRWTCRGVLIDDKVARAVAFLRKTDGLGTIQQKVAFMQHKGLTDTEILEALNRVTDGAVVASALGDA